MGSRKEKILSEDEKELKRCEEKLMGLRNEQGRLQGALTQVVAGINFTMGEISQVQKRIEKEKKDGGPG